MFSDVQARNVCIHHNYVCYGGIDVVIVMKLLCFCPAGVSTQDKAINSYSLWKDWLTGSKGRDGE